MGYKNIHVKIKCERSEREKIEIELSWANSYNWMRAKWAEKNLKIEVSRAKRAEFFWKTLHFFCFPPNSSKFRSDYLFSFQNRTDYSFPVFLRSEYLFPKSASPPPPLRIKWSSPYNQRVWPRWSSTKIHKLFALHCVSFSPPRNGAPLHPDSVSIERKQTSADV